MKKFKLRTRKISQRKLDTLKSITGRLIKLARNTKNTETKEVLGSCASMLVRLLVLRQ